MNAEDRIKELELELDETRKKLKESQDTRVRQNERHVEDTNRIMEITAVNSDLLAENKRLRMEVEDAECDEPRGS